MSSFDSLIFFNLGKKNFELRIDLPTLNNSSEWEAEITVASGKQK